MKRVLITGITGQDGHHLAKFLEGKRDYEIYGLINGQKKEELERFKLELPFVNFIGGDLTDSSSILNALEESTPFEVYNLAAISYVGISFKQPELTANVTGLGTLRLLEAIRQLKMSGDIRFYQASSSEMFGKVRQVPQNEETPFHPRSPYGVSKTFAHYTAVNYREAYGMFVSCGIMFNHEGENRGLEFVTRKITHGLSRIALGMQDKLRLGSLDPRRDWGYAGDYVEAMWLMLQSDKPDDFVIATGQTYSVREFLAECFNLLGIELGIERFIEFDPNLKRPSEVDLLIGDATKAKTVLGWEPKTSFKDLVRIMLRADLLRASTESGKSLSNFSKIMDKS